MRILLQRMEIGMNFNSILDYYNPHAKKLYSAFNNMKELCKRLSDPKYVALLKMTHAQNARDIIDQNRCVHKPTCCFLVAQTHTQSYAFIPAAKSGGPSLKSHLKSKRQYPQCFLIEHRLKDISRTLRTDTMSWIKYCQLIRLRSPA